jgi:serine/threonine protein kinase
MLGLRTYSLPIDVWSAGVIFAELGMYGKALFNGECEFDQLVKIFKFLGTPGHMPDCEFFRPEIFPRWPTPRKSLLPFKDGTPELDLLKSMLHYDPNKRISVRGALEHAYFTEAGRGDSPVTKSPGTKDCPIEVSDDDE